MSKQHPPVHEHADRHKKETGETVAERQHFGYGLMAVLRFGNDQSSDECSYCQREAAERGEPGDAGTGDNDRQQEQLAAAAPDDIDRKSTRLNSSHRT